ncbi:MAG: VWA containing CoxE family protein, partial [Lachnospiraceae bacterium]|nr:VWA containing CoxE family protein [Lachnospiraceae bacterium]
MFINFFYGLKEAGLKVTLSEWLNLQDALERGLCNSSLTEFYYLARMILVKSETDYDKFDIVFEAVFKAASMETEVSKNMLKWLDKPEMNELLNEMDKQWLNKLEDTKVDKDEVEEKFKQRLRDQDSEHNGGSHWIGTMGKTSFGNTGGNVGGVRVGGATGYQS